MNIIQQFFNYALTQNNSSYTIIDQTSNKYPSILYQNENVLGTLSLNEYENYHIIDMKVENLNKQKVTFYLHFDLQELQRAKELLNEMLEALKNEIENKDINILLCCTSGITTTYLKEKLNDATKLLNLPYHFEATYYKIIHQEACKYDLILLAPQISHEQATIQNHFPDIPTAVIESKSFATTDVATIFKQIKHVKCPIQDEVLIPQKKLDTLKNTLCLCIRIEHEQINIYPAFFHLGKTTCLDNILKNKYCIQDIFDILDYALTQFETIDTIVISTPGSVDKNKFTFHTEQLEDIDLLELFKQKYSQNIYFINDANAMALGYYTRHPEYKNLAFYFHPINTFTRIGGMGYIIDSSLNIGTHAIRGEVQYMLPTLQTLKESTNNTLTENELIDVISKYLIGSIVHVDPEAIVFYCPKVSSVKAMQKAIEKYIQPRFIPEIIQVNHCIGYMLLGSLMFALDQNRTFDYNK